MIQVAWFALFSWPIVTIVLFRKYSLPVALCAAIIGGFLLLPTREGLDLPVLPRLDKNSIPALSAFVMTLVVLSHKTTNPAVLHGWIPRGFVVPALLIMLLVGTFGTALSNGDPLFFGPRFIPGMKLYDAFSLLLEALMFLIPFLLARRILASVEGQKILLISVVVSALCYSLLALWEVRMSPQLNVHIYGFRPHSFMQHMRAGGFRPLVFLNHGLQLGIFLAMATLGAVAVFRTSQQKDRLKWMLAVFWLLMSLVLAKTIGALAIAFALLPVAWLLTSRTQLLVAACVAGIVMTYPVLRAVQLIPTEQVSNLAAKISVERAESLNFRLGHEDALLARAQERPVFGWGGYSRNRIFNEFGRDISVTDGFWVIQLGVGGWFRYIAVFGLLCWPIVGLFIAKRDRIDPVCGILALMLAAKLLDLIPNSGLSAVSWLIAGSLLGRLEVKLSALKDPDSEAVPEAASKLGYTRYPKDGLKQRSTSTPRHQTRRVP